MTLTFNSNKYGELLSHYQPKLIRTEDENQKALAIAEELMHRPNRSLEEDELYDLLILLIEKFEQEFYSPGAVSTPASLLQFLMEQRQLKAVDLVSVLGSEATIDAVVNGDRELTIAQAKALGLFFQVDPVQPRTGN